MFNACVPCANTTAGCIKYNIYTMFVRELYLFWESFCTELLTIMCPGEGNLDKKDFDTTEHPSTWKNMCIAH